MGETAFGLSAAKKDLATAVHFASTLHAELPVTASAVACYEEAEAAGLGDADDRARLRIELAKAMKRGGELFSGCQIPATQLRADHMRAV